MKPFSELKQQVQAIAQAASAPAEIVALIDGAANAQDLQFGIAALQAAIAAQGEAYATGLERAGNVTLAAKMRTQDRLAAAEWERIARRAGLR